MDGDRSDSATHEAQQEQDVQQPSRTSPITLSDMLSDPLESPSSDTMSFDEDDMYGSDSDVETISLKPFLNKQETNANESLVYHYLFYHV